MLPTLRKLPFSDPAWIFEPKWDGYRALCLIEHKSVRFMSRNKKELTKRFPELSIIH
jgi:bifunctional non-homologous end joining protein LigD